jgi:hypothetical protein
VITDDLCATIEQLLPRYARELDVRFDISWSLLPMPTREGGTALVTVFQLLFICPSPVLGAPPLSFAESLPIEAVLQDHVLEQLVAAITEQMRAVRFDLLTAGRRA